MSSENPKHSTVAYPAAGGEMDALMRAKEWSQTRLGPRETWPQSLRTALSIVLSSRFPMIIFWGSALCVLYNDAYIPVLATKHPDVLGKTGFEAWGEIWDVIGPMLDAVMNRGEATWSSDQLLIMRRKGFPEETYFTWSFSPIADESGGVGGVFTSVIDTTERVLAERRLKKLRELGEYAATGKSAAHACEIAADVLCRAPCDLPFGLLYLLEGKKARLAAICGIDKGHAIARPELPVAEGAIWPFATVMATGRPQVLNGLGERVGSLPGGPWPEPADTAVVLPIPSADPHRPFGFIVAAASPRLELDEQYRAFFSLLANQVGSAVANAVAYEQERKRAEALAELDQAKTTFFSNVSHEFRTPLTLILGPLEDALAESSRTLSSENLEIAYRNALRLLKLVNGLLDFSRIEAGRVQASFEPTDLAALTTELSSVFRSAVERAGLKLIVHCDVLPESVYIDREMWEKIVLNLLSNAFKFTFEGQIEVTLRHKDDRVELSVSDTGVGVSSEALPRLFERFYRAEGVRARSREGSGIGLSLIQELVRMHGGEIRVESEHGKGTTFTVVLRFGSDHLPKDRIAAPRTLASTATQARAFVEEALRWLPGENDLLPASGPPYQTTTGIEDARILWADDNADMREYVARLLRQHWKVVACADGEAALQALHSDKFDLVVTNVMMPRLDGFGLLHAIKTDPSTRLIPVIMLSARAGEETRIDGLQAGADDYLIKPFSARELVARVSTHLHLSRLRSTAEERLKEQRQIADKARARAEEAARSKDEFLAMLGHELRNPLAPISMAIHLLRLRGVQSQEQDIIERQVDHLVRLVDDLLDVSRITGGKTELRKQPLELASAVISAIEMTSPLLERRHQRLDMDIAPDGLVVDADPNRLAQIVANLLANASKYSDDRSRIAITAVKKNGCVQLKVADEGIGIAPEMLERIFDLFVQQRQALDRAAGGLGLGLPIARSLAHLHGGSVTAASAGPGKGSEFVIELPLTPPAPGTPPGAPETASSAPSPAAAASKKRILVVDDNEDVAGSLARMLQALGHTVEVAHDGPSALAIARRFRPEIAFLDIGLPRMDGYELARQLRKEHEIGSKMRLIAITGYGQETDRLLAKQAGFDVHLVKPASLRLLMAAIT